MKKRLPKFVSLAENLKKEIAARSPGERFYTQQEIMKKYQVSCATVSRVMLDLTEAGLLTRKTGNGTFIRSTEESVNMRNEEIPELTLVLTRMSNDLDPEHLNWFINAEIQQRVTNCYPGRCRIVMESDFSQFLHSGVTRRVIVVNPQPETVERIRQTHLPYIIINQNQRHWKTNSVNINHMTGMLEALNYLNLELGHRRIALITVHNKSHTERIEAFKIAMHTLELDFTDESIIFAEGGAPRDGAEAMKKLLKLREPPTAVIADTDLKALGILHHLKNASIRVPGEISVIGFDNLPESAESDPPLTTIDCSMRQMSENAVAMLETLIQSGGTEIPNRTVLTSLLVRESCAPVVSFPPS